MLKIFKTKQVKELDAYTIKHEPIASERLMERASNAMTEWIYEHFDVKTSFVFFIGPGNNGGDGLVMARLMKIAGYSISVYSLTCKSKLSPDCQLNYDRFINCNGVIQKIDINNELPMISKDAIIVDALFGSGLSRPLQGEFRQLVLSINKLSNQVIAVDIPSGLMGEENKVDNDAILRANITLTLQFPKLSFLCNESAIYVGDWFVIDIGLHPKIIEETLSEYFLMQYCDINSMQVIRNKFDHKGVFGHALLVGGSYGKIGASVLAARASLSAGCGLLTCHIPKCGYSIMQTSVPEAMVVTDENESYIGEVKTLNKYNCIAIGPGIGQNQLTQNALDALLTEIEVPIVLDADALNIIASNPILLNKIPKESVLTPHPKEFERLFGVSSNSIEQLELLKTVSKKYKLNIVLKGAYTRISDIEGVVYFNNTGNPALAKAGSGDVLTGIILGLISQGYKPKEAAIKGVWMHGLIADEYIKHYSTESMLASDIINGLKSIKI